MNRDQTAEAVEIMSAWLEGKTIQATSRNQGHGYWSSCNPESTIWAFDRFDYRIAPEPMEIEVWVDGKTGVFLSVLGDRDHQAFMERSGYAKKKFREVL